jgi:hypothetical protein
LTSGDAAHDGNRQTKSIEDGDLVVDDGREICYRLVALRVVSGMISNVSASHAPGVIRR